MVFVYWAGKTPRLSAIEVVTELNKKGAGIGHGAMQ